jgi:transcription antitermination factor NusG
MQYWLIASYKINETRRLEQNLINQKFKYYLPKILTKKINTGTKEEVLFPGYVFVKTDIDNYLALKNTIGIKKVIKFGDSLSFISNDEIKAIKSVEKKSKIKPVFSEIQIGQDAMILKGSLKGSVVKVCSLPSKKRIDILLSILGSSRRVSIPIQNVSF